MGPASGPSSEVRHEGNDEENDEHPEQKPRAFHRNAGNTAKADGGCDKRDDKEHERVVEQISHDHFPIVHRAKAPVTFEKRAAPWRVPKRLNNAHEINAASRRPGTRSQRARCKLWTVQ